MSFKTEISPNSLGGEDIRGELAMVAGQTDQEVAGKVIKPGRVGKITAFRCTWDSALDHHITLTLRVNGVPCHPYELVTVSTGTPDQDVYLDEYIPVNGNSRISITATTDSTSGSGYVAVAAKVAYYENY